MDIEPRPNNMNFLAIRSSCDRCRYMKLKCPSTGTESHERCERCSKAKLPCTYSRRTNSSRRPTAAQENTMDTADSHDRMPAPEVLVEDQGSSQSDGGLGSISERVPEVHSDSVDPFCYTNALGVLEAELPWGDWDVPSTESITSLWPAHSTPFSEHHESRSVVPSTESITSLGPAHSTPFSEHHKSRSVQCILSLANLAVGLGECVQLLRSDIRPQSIDDYPIGHIRHLSGAFVASSQNTPSSATDIPETLLLLSCYVSLRKLYINAFANIKYHLPMGNETQTQVSHAQDHRNMRLGGMDMLSERYMRSYTAFNITLDLLHTCDAALGLCTICRPPAQSTSPTSLSSMHCVGPGDNFSAALEKPSTACIACALPASLRKEAASIFSTVADQEHALLEVVSFLRVTLRQRMGL
ncbi:hypothetical protein CC80DRAFT_491426 [Byssothecium circinans]|uniref:Zn(2)-C6 fungal-type domain-containing protein n=1 Tax=Byssothecium circinans TaxID=147558 RepID=A0A6A5U822_9PLEO|nr:hypothetical protein CC80DRAFT_491426 [Byssothecium circinans]